MGDVAVVTGAGHGIGRAVSLLLARRGYRVVVTDVDLAAAERTAADLPAGTGGGPVAALALDVRDAAAHRAAAAAAARHGRLAVWVNNAGVLEMGRPWTQDDEAVRRMVEVNVLGVVHGCRAAVTVMAGGPGRGDIVNVASLAAFTPTPGLAVYAATKAAVLGFTMSLHHDLRDARLPVRVHALCPDSAATGMVLDHLQDPHVAMQLSAPRLLPPEEVAAAAVALVGSRRVVRSQPPLRGALARAGGLLPVGARPALRVLERYGERRRRFAQRSGQPFG